MNHKSRSVMMLMALVAMRRFLLLKATATRRRTTGVAQAKPMDASVKYKVMNGILKDRIEFIMSSLVLTEILTFRRKKMNSPIKNSVAVIKLVLTTSDSFRMT